MGNTQDIEAALNALCPAFIGDHDHIEGLQRLSGGASQETWAFDAVSSNGEARSLILRRAPGGVSAARSSAAIGLSKEAALIRAAAAADVPVPAVAHVCAPGDGLGDAFIMQRIEGETIAPKILRSDGLANARERLAGQCGDALARIHRLDLSDLPDLPVSFGTDQIDQYEEIYRSFNTPKPVFELAMSWLRAHEPAPLKRVLVHGDFRLGNLMVDADGLVGVLDWELAHIGDPREDLAWICINSWRFGNAHKRVGGFGDLSELLDAYAGESEIEIDAKDIDWWELLGSFKWGVMCMIMYEAFRSGSDPSVERAAIGRRVSETEIDIINLLERI